MGSKKWNLDGLEERARAAAPPSGTPPGEVVRLHKIFVESEHKRLDWEARGPLQRLIDRVRGKKSW